MKKLTFVTILVLLLAGGATAYWGLPGSTQTEGRGQDATRVAAASVPVVIAMAQTADVPITLEGVGTVRARNTVTVRPQVDGRLLSVNFKEGQTVEKGDLLAKIDPATYQAALDQAFAKKALDEALLANQKHDLERYEKVGTLAESQQQIDTQRALVRQQEAQIKADQAAIDNATAILGYTNIVSPLRGRTGIRIVDEGNLIRSADAAGIVVITEIQPISVLFTLPQQDLPQIRKDDPSKVLVAEAFTTDGKTQLETGSLQVIDNQIDPATGTVRLKAEFPNTTLALWPGQFVNVRLRVDTLKGVVVVPPVAVQRGPAGTFVFVVTDDGMAAVRQVTVGRQTETEAVIEAGLNAGDKVITSGFGRLSDGAKIADVTNPPPAAPPLTGEPHTAQNGNREGRRNNASNAP
ncbi:efflux RND transporter periplasmic adaptor subunit [Hyphomicrobium sp.]|uniref:efflux RND transporter periplasmic adaptor subunit n=1 Tax=Hyphomicrobium sp. TaxID=82 RepID=UPI003F71731C